MFATKEIYLQALIAYFVTRCRSYAEACRLMRSVIRIANQMSGDSVAACAGEQTYGIWGSLTIEGVSAFYMANSSLMELTIGDHEDMWMTMGADSDKAGYSYNGDIVDVWNNGR